MNENPVSQKKNQSSSSKKKSRKKNTVSLIVNVTAGRQVLLFCFVKLLGPKHALILDIEHINLTQQRSDHGPNLNAAAALIESVDRPIFYGDIKVLN